MDVTKNKSAGASHSIVNLRTWQRLKFDEWRKSSAELTILCSPFGAIRPIDLHTAVARHLKPAIMHAASFTDVSFIATFPIF
jgi:hypothetical protein